MRASAKVLKINGDERKSNGRRISKKYLPNHLKPNKGQLSGWTGQIRKACLISILAMKQPTPSSLTSDVALLKEEYLTGKNSEGIPSLTEAPWGEERFKTRRIEPSFLGTAPRGEQWKDGKGEKGPAVWPRESSRK